MKKFAPEMRVPVVNSQNMKQIPRGLRRERLISKAVG
jgi:hypothetical protein